MAKERRTARAAHRSQMAKAEADRRLAKARAQDFRARRSLAFKRNVEKFGLPKAKLIATIITKKQKGTFKFTPKDAIRAKLFISGCETGPE